MAYTIIDRNDMDKKCNCYYRKKFQVEKRTDIETLPNFKSAADMCSPGSTAYCEEDGSVWYLSVDGITWKEMV